MKNPVLAGFSCETNEIATEAVKSPEVGHSINQAEKPAQIEYYEFAGAKALFMGTHSGNGN
jgi:hypothetical protein